MMHETIRIIVWKEWTEIRKQRHLAYGLLVLLVMWLSNIGFVSTSLVRAFGRRAVEMIVDSVVTHQSLTVYAIVSVSLVQSVFARERHSRSLECLLAAPVSVYAVWLGKSLSVFFGGLLVSLLVALGVIIEMNVMYGAEYGVVIPSWPALLFLVTAGPALSLAFCTLVGLLFFNSRLYAVGSIIYMFLGTGYLFFASQKMDKMTMTTDRVLLYIGAAAVLFFLSWGMSRGLDKEKVILCQ